MVEIDQLKKMNMRDLDPKEERRVRPEPNDELQKIQIRAKPKKFSFIGQELPKAIKAKLKDLLSRNAYLFAWAPKDMPGIDSRVICYKLTIAPKGPTYVAEEEEIGDEKTKGGNAGNDEVVKGWIHKRNTLHKLIG